MVRTVFASLKNPRKPWLWLILLVVLYGLALGLLAPWLIQKQATSVLRERAELNLSIDKLHINPFFFQVDIQGLAIAEQNGEPVAGFDRLFVNFEPTGIFRWAWSFDEVWLLGLTGNFERFTETDSNFSRLAERWAATAPPPEAPPTEEPEDAGSGLPRLYFNDIRFEAERLTVVDHVPDTRYHTDIGPIRLKVEKLSTLPDEVGEQVIRIVTDRGTELTWHGELSLQPVASSGQINVAGPVAHIVTDYLQDMLNFYVPKDDFNLDLKYEFALDEAGAPRVKISDLNLLLQQFAMLDKTDDSPLFELESLNVARVSIKWPEQKVLVEEVTLAGGKVHARRLADGSINFESLVNQPEQAQEQPPAAASQTDTEPAKPWVVSNDSLALRDWQVEFIDNTLKEPAIIAAEINQIVVSDFSTEPESRISSSAEIAFSNGAINLRNQLQLFPLADIQVQANIENVGLEVVQPYLQEFSKAVLKSGALAVTATVNSETGEFFNVQGDVAVDNFHMDETLSNNELVGWQRFEINDINANTAEQQVQVGLVRLSQPFVEFAIEEDGSNTFGRVFAQEVEPVQQDEPQASAEPSGQAAEQSQPFHVRVANVQVQDGSAHFADASLPLPFDTNIAKLNGEVSTIDNRSEAPSALKMKGQIDEYGLLQADGAITPFDPKKNSDITLKFTNVVIPEFTPYSVKFAGRKIDSGRLDLDLNYKVQNSQMVGENTIVLRKLELGEKVEQPDAMDLPLDLAIALLKDSNGEIDLDLAVEGDTNSPEFSVASVVGQALAKVIRSVATAPFKLLGNLVGAEGDSLEQVTFEPGSAELLPPEKEKLVQLAEALKQRPKLVLKIKNTYAVEADTRALQEQAFSRSVDEYFGDKAEGIAQTDKKYVRFVEEMYQEKNIQPALEVVASQHTPVDANGKKAELDTLAYVAHLTEAVSGAIAVSRSQLTQLARSRTEAIATYSRSENLYDADQFVVDNEVAEVKSDDGVVPVTFVLDAQ